jgi:predicted permease
MAGQVVSDNYFAALGMKAAAGRFFSPQEARRGAAPVVVVSHALWQRLFAGDSDLTGRTLSVNGQVFEVLGVAARRFQGTVRGERTDVWIPMEMAPLVMPSMSPPRLEDREFGWLLWFFGRLRPDVDLTRARAGMDALSLQVAEEAGPGEAPALQIHPYVGIRPGQQHDIAAPLKYLAIAVALLMLVVCANTGGLLLVMLAARQGEIAIRLALGARQGTIVGQVMTEALLLSLLGTAVGLGLASGLMTMLEGAALGRFLPDLHQLSLDSRVLAAASILALINSVAFGLLPGIWASRTNVLAQVRQTNPGRSGSRLWLQQPFLVAQTAAAVVLVVCACLFVRTLRSLESLDVGFNPEHVLNLRIDLELQRYEEPAGLSFYEHLLEGLQSLPGVDSAAFALAVPLNRGNNALVRIGDVRPSGSGAHEPAWIPFNVVSPRYFRTLGVSVIQGRDFSASDRSTSPRALIINQAMGDKLFPGIEPAGQRVDFGGTLYEVAGVVENIRFQDLKSVAEPRFYVSMFQHYEPRMTLHVKSRLDPGSMVAAVIAEMRRLDPQIAVYQVELFRNEVRRVLAEPRLLSALFGGFGLAAMLITAIGLYGALAYSVSRRIRELGVRMALGARPRQVVLLVTRQALLVTGIGIAIGLGVALLIARAFASMLYGVSPTDPAVFVAVALIGLAVGLAAAVVPAVAAARVDPIATLRHE